MLTKLLALWIVILAASPFTEPFSTFKVSELTGKGNTAAHRRSTADLACAMTLDGTATTEFPNNPPIEVRPIVGMDAHVRVVLTIALGADPAASTDSGRAVALEWDRHQALEISQTRPLAVLRL